MATYALTYATRAAFNTALASGDIYTLMQGVTSSQPSVAIAAHITETGETFSCGTNVMIDIKSVGPGDYVMYCNDSNHPSYKRFFGIASKWIDNNYPNQPTQHIMIFKAGVLPSGFVVCGTVIKRFGNRIRLAGTPSPLPWSTTNTSGYSWNVPTLTSYTYVLKKSRTKITEALVSEWSAFPSQRYQEAYFPNGNGNYLPITRSTWNAAVVAGQETVTQNNVTVTLADYDYSYDKWITYNCAPLWPASSGCYSDKDGIGNTKKIVTEFVANHGKTTSSTDFAAGYCYNYSVNAPNLGKGQWFLGVIKDVGEIRALTHTLISPMAWGNNGLWSSSQCAASQAYNVFSTGSVFNPSKYYAFEAIPLADLILET